MDELALTQRLVTYDTSTVDGIGACAGFIKGWLESYEIKVEDRIYGGLPVLLAQVGPDRGPTIIFHGHIDVVPGRLEQFVPRIDGDRLIGRGTYDMKGGLAAMMCSLRSLVNQTEVCVRFMCVPDEESEDIEQRSTDELIREGVVGDFTITGEPTDLHVGIEAKGVLVCRILVSGRSAHGSTPWLGDNAVVKAIDVFREIQSLPFAKESSRLFDCPSINLGRIAGGDVLNRVPDECTMYVDIRYLPEQDPNEIVEQVRSIKEIAVQQAFTRIPAQVSADDPYVRGLVSAIGRSASGPVLSVGRDGASDAVSFIEAGIPAVEFGPTGAGHHGPEEWVSISSLVTYRKALTNFILDLPSMDEEDAGEASTLRAIDSGLA